MRFDIVTFTVIHVVLSVVGIVAGLVVVGGLASGRRLDGWTGLFLGTTVLTNVTGFGFPFVSFLPSHGVGILSLLLLPVVLYARYGKQLAGPWRRIYVLGAVTVLYLNVFVLIAQLFRRVPRCSSRLRPSRNLPSFSPSSSCSPCSSGSGAPR
jgi:hypothetical protein